jgi:hypothetical protein
MRGGSMPLKSHAVSADKVKPTSDIGKQSKAKDGLQPRCKVCALEYLKQRKRVLRLAWVEDD